MQSTPLIDIKCTPLVACHKNQTLNKDYNFTLLTNRTIMTEIKSTLLLIALCIICSACSPTKEKPTINDDIQFLKHVPGFHVLKNKNARLLVSSSYQGRVFAASANGDNGESIGWYNKTAIEQMENNPKLNTCGGLSRFMFGPEIGKYAIFFDPNTEQTADNIRVSPQLNTRFFKLHSSTKNSITCGNTMQIRNANSTIFDLDIKRIINLKSTEEIENELDIKIDKSVQPIAFSAETSIKNTGQDQWTKESGLLSIWELSCLSPSSNTLVIIPLAKEAKKITEYFTPLGEERISINKQTVIYKADAQYMNKIGVQPELCKNVFGSYDPEQQLLTIVKYTFNKDGTFVNSLWGHQKPYNGDVINVFNGEVNSELDRNWPFYELETSSCAKELMPGESMQHTQTLYHFKGTLNQLNKISLQVLGVDLKTVIQ